MDLSEKELNIYRICSGKLKYKNYVLKNPSIEARYIAQQIYNDTLIECELEGVMNEQELFFYLMDSGIWDEEKEKMINSLPKEIEEFKVELLNSIFKEQARNAIRKAIKIAKEKLASLISERNSHNHLSCSGIASIKKNRYLLWASIFEDTQSDFNDCESKLIDDIMSYYNKVRISDENIREISRTEPWRSYWSLRKLEKDFFKCSVLEYSDEQKTLISWSMLYDNIFQHPNCPSENIINDDDMLDGWMILQKRERNKASDVKDGEDFIKNEKIKNSSEVYILADSEQDAKKIENMNDLQALHIKKQRERFLREKGGIVNEMEMPDTKRNLEKEVTRKLSKTMGTKNE